MKDSYCRTVSTLITAYRGKAGILDQVGGAGVAGFLYKFKDGPKAAVSGTVVGNYSKNIL
jgi:hypothetical protein